MNSMRSAQVLPRLTDFARRHGSVITTRDILRLGGNPDATTRFVRAGILIRLHVGVYVLGGTVVDHPLAVRAALAAVGNGAVASHHSAAWLQGLIPDWPTQVHLTASAYHRGLKGVTVHRSKAFDRRMHRGVPCTPPARTLVDLAATCSPEELADAVDRGLASGLVRTRDLLAEISRPIGERRGTGALRRCLQDRGYIGAPTPSVLESKMGRLFVRYGLPRARSELVVGPSGEYRLDYAHSDQRLVIELYGYTWHHSPDQMAADLARQRRLTLEGWTVMVFTWQDVVKQPARVAREIRTAL